MVNRVKRIANVDDIMKADIDTLVDEYANVSVVRDHEFQNETTRKRYARMVYAIGSFKFGDDFYHTASMALVLQQEQHDKDMANPKNEDL